jgi:hypothetical protein
MNPELPIDVCVRWLVHVQTWTEQVCLLLMHDGDTSVLNPATKNSFNAETKIGKIWLEPMIDSGGGGPGARRSGPPGGGGEFQNIALDDFLALPSPRLIKTHNAVKLFVGGDNADGSGTGNPCGGARVVCESTPATCCFIYDCAPALFAN